MLEKFMQKIGIQERADSFCGKSCVVEFWSYCTLSEIGKAATLYQVCRDGSKKQIGCC
ncbi:hypothetical protein [Bacillus paranthracis]|uniref:hypothetical protein n=1 Tax=Bacillus paranthracis TaxID=2026186 RepID=UPI00298C8DEA|nr:hypothetical protein [Bacillus paranthracis]